MANISPASRKKRRAEQTQKSRTLAVTLEREFLEDFRVGFMLCSLLEDPDDPAGPIDYFKYKRPVEIATVDCTIGERYKAFVDSNPGNSYCFMESNGFFRDHIDYSAATMRIELLGPDDWSEVYLAPCRKVWKPHPTQPNARIINDMHHLYAAETIHQLRTHEGVGGGYDGVKALFFTQANIHKSICEKGLHVTQKFLSDNVDMMVLCGGAYFR